MLKRTYFMAVIDGVFCLRMGALHRPRWHFSCFTFHIFHIYSVMSYAADNISRTFSPVSK